MKYLFLLLSLYQWLFADIFDAMILEFSSSINSEYEASLKKESNPNFVNDNSYFHNSFSELAIDYELSDTFYALLNAKASYQLYEKKYTDPNYSRTIQYAKELNRAEISQASFNYDDGLFVLNAGRNDIDYEYLSGSMDGVIAMIGSDESYSLRLLYLYNLQKFYYNYFKDMKAINNKKMEKGLSNRASLILKPDKAQKALVIPHPGQGKPVTRLKGQKTNFEPCL